MDTHKRKFYESQIFFHNETKIHDYLKEAVEEKEYFFENYLQPNQNNEFLELGLNSSVNSKTKQTFKLWNTSKPTKIIFTKKEIK